MMSLISVLIQLSTPEGQIVPGYLGRATHAWLLSQVKRHDAQLSEALHTPNQERPFTVSDIWGAGIRRDGNERILAPRQPMYLRVTSFSARLTDLLVHQVLPALPADLTLGPATFHIDGVYLAPSQLADEKLQVWVGQTTFEELVARYTLQPHLSRKVRLLFASPTVFRSNKAYLPIPLPRLVFESLVRKWNTFSTILVHEAVNRYAEEAMVISRYRLRTETIRWGDESSGGVVPGFVGSCTFTARHYDRYWMGLIHLLAAFARYAGVGRNTAMGLGQTRLVEAN